MTTDAELIAKAEAKIAALREPIPRFEVLGEGFRKLAMEAHEENASLLDGLVSHLRVLSKPLDDAELRTRKDHAQIVLDLLKGKSVLTTIEIGAKLLAEIILDPRFSRPARALGLEDCAKWHDEKAATARRDRDGEKTLPGSAVYELRAQWHEQAAKHHRALAPRDERTGNAEMRTVPRGLLERVLDVLRYSNTHLPAANDGSDEDLLLAIAQVKNALSASQPGTEREGWRSMDSAPEDGTPVDLWCRAPGLSAGPARTPDCWYHEGHWWRHDFDHGDDQGRSRVHNATHWRDIPSPPGER